jgi:TRAP-type C4-dicarboxylate transport system permease large subunit
MGRALATDLNMSIGPIIPPAVAMLLLGILARRHRPDAWIAITAGCAVFWMAMSRGFYWDLFGRGEGFFTANRITAMIALAALLFAPIWNRAPKSD